MRNVEANARAKPNHPVCSSQSFALSITDLGMPLRTGGPGTRSTEMRAMIQAGAARATAINVPKDIFCFSTYGNEIFGSVRSNGMRLGDIFEKPTPMAAITITTIQSDIYDSASPLEERIVEFAKGLEDMTLVARFFL